jgi:hypothetical protein
MKTLWRITGSQPTETSWNDGLLLHLKHSPLTTIAMRVCEQQRQYLMLEGCGRCLREACTIGCRVSLFRRLAAANGLELHAVKEPQGLAKHPYTQYALIWPGAQAQELQLEMLSEYTEARMVVHWQILAGRLLVSGMCMVIGNPPLKEALAAQGWHCLPLPATLLQRRVAPMPARLPLGMPWHAVPFVLMDSAIQRIDNVE